MTEQENIGTEQQEGATGGTPAVFDFDKWLSEQQEDVKSAYKEHTAGLTSALRKERDAAKGATKRLQELEEADQKRKEAELSEVERLNAKLQKEAEAREAAESRANRLLTRFAFMREAERQKLAFVDESAKDDAFALADLSGVAVSDEDTITGIDVAVKALAKAKPYLFKRPELGNTDGDAGTGSGGPPPRDTETKKAELRSRFGIK